jgi:hypothetical protein
MKTVTFNPETHAVVPIELLNAVDQLIKGKGRFHTEQNFNALKSAHFDYSTAPEHPADAGWISVDERFPDTSRKVIAYYKNELGKDRQVMAFYAKKYEIESESNDGSGCESDYSEEKDAFFIPKGWYEKIENWDDYSSLRIESAVTNWKERSPAPESK